MLKPVWSTRIASAVTFLFLTTIVVGSLSSTAGAADAPRAADFKPAAPQGFGDRQNSIAWSMIWWKGDLYVGTGRSTQCVQVATEAVYLPFVTYPPLERDIACASSPQDLDLSAEIWRWSPRTNTWRRVLETSYLVPIPDHPGKSVARDTGYRGMTIFTEPDGTEALYIAGVSSRSFNGAVPGPRLLRTTDGVTFTGVPVQPGTALGAPDAVGFRGLLTFRDKLYVLMSIGLLGQGYILEASDPAGGNDNFRRITPEGMTVYEMAAFNDQLYIGTASKSAPFEVLRTNARGNAPYRWTTVIREGGFRDPASKAVVSMHVFKDRLFVGTDRPAEVFRINPNNTWNLIVGSPRSTPSGRKAPLSGISTGFDWFATQHIWRMETYEDQLFIGTMDLSTRLRILPFGGTLLGPNLGFDLFSSSDGEQFTEITRDGFGDPFSIGVRNMVASPSGLFLGSQNHYYGLNIWRNAPNYTVALPLVRTTYDPSYPGLDEKPLARVPLVPARVAAEPGVAGTVLSWEAAAGATAYRVYRRDFALETRVADPAMDAPWVSGAWKPIGITEGTAFVDRAARADRFFHYYVVALNANGTSSAPSTVVRVPSLAPPTTGADLRAAFDAAIADDTTISAPDRDAISGWFDRIDATLLSGDLVAARRAVDGLHAAFAAANTSDRRWWLRDLDRAAAALDRRIDLAQRGLIAPEGLAH